MNQKLTDAYRLAFTLKEEGKSWAEITQVLKDKQYTNQQARPIPASSLRKEYSSCKRDPAKWRHIMGEDPWPEHDAESSVTGEARMRQIAEEVCREIIQNVRNELKEGRTALHGTTLELSDLPKPEKTGRKENRLYLKLGATVDLVLVDHLMTLAEKEGSIGKALDHVLWEAFGRPDLSYQLSPEQLKPLKEKHKAALAALDRKKRK